MNLERYWLIFGVILSVLMGALVVAYWLDLPILDSERILPDSAGLGTALIAVVLLISDILVPMPSSVIMVALGVMFGIALGTTISMVGRATGFIFGYFLGKVSSPLIARFVSARDMDRAASLLERRGMLALILTRPIPIIGDTIIIAAGVSRLPFWRSFLASMVGSFPEAILYAILGATAASFNATAVIFVALIAIAIVVYLLTR